MKSFKKILGYLMLTSVFIGLFIFGVMMCGLLGAVIVFAASLAIVLLVVFGVILIED